MSQHKITLLSLGRKSLIPSIWLGSAGNEELDVWAIEFRYLNGELIVRNLHPFQYDNDSKPIWSQTKDIESPETAIVLVEEHFHSQTFLSDLNLLAILRHHYNF